MITRLRESVVRILLGCPGNLPIMMWNRIRHRGLARLSRYGGFMQIYANWQVSNWGPGYLGPPSTVCRNVFGLLNGKMTGHATQFAWHDQSVFSFFCETRINFADLESAADSPPALTWTCARTRVETVRPPPCTRATIRTRTVVGVSVV